mgnify:CR=1 FL=1
MPFPLDRRLACSVHENGTILAFAPFHKPTVEEKAVVVAGAKQGANEVEPGESGAKFSKTMVGGPYLITAGRQLPASGAAVREEATPALDGPWTVAPWNAERTLTQSLMLV